MGIFMDRTDLEEGPAVLTVYADFPFEKNDLTSYPGGFDIVDLTLGR